MKRFLLLVPTLVALSFVLGCSSNKPATANGANGGQSPVTTTSSPRSGFLVTHTEIADNHNGTPVFSTPEGAPPPAGIPSVLAYGTKIQVICYLPLPADSALTSVNGFYKFTMNGVTLYAPANTFENGGGMGNNPITVDPLVSTCW